MLEPVTQCFAVFAKAQQATVEKPKADKGNDEEHELGGCGNGMGDYGLPLCLAIECGRYRTLRNRSYKGSLQGLRRPPHAPTATRHPDGTPRRNRVLVLLFDALSR